MDSGNSDSFQSSNGGDNEEYNSHGGGDTIAALINQSTTRGAGLTYNSPLHHQSTNQSMFDPINSNYQNMQNNLLLNNNNNNLDLLWSKTPGSDPNCIESTHKLSSNQLCLNSNLPSSLVQETMNTRLRNAQLLLDSNEIINTTSALQVPDHHEKHGFASVNCQNINKKRSRASRRAPTTVLTTDTTNFRAMVQEFTGIPAPPFTSSSSSLFPRNNNTKLDNLFGTPSSMRTNNLEYFSTPFSTKVVQPMVGVSMDDSYKLLQSSNNHFTMQNPIIASLLQSNPPKTTFCDNYQSIFESKTCHGSMQMQSSNRVLDEFSTLGQGLVDKNASVGALPGLVSADPGRWGGGSGGANGGGVDQARSFGNNNNGGYDDLSRNGTNGKRLKGMIIEDGATNEGMMETWICSSTK